MIILRNHFEGKDIAIYGDVVSNGCQTFYISKLDEVCKEYKVPEEIKQDVLKHHQANLGKDDISADILDELIEKRNETLICAVLFATQNSFLLEKAMSIFKTNQDIIHRLAQDVDPDVRATIAHRRDLNSSLTVIKKY